MEALFPYIVLVIVIILFYILCHLLFFHDSKKQEKNTTPMHISTEHPVHSQIKDYGSTYYSHVKPSQTDDVYDGPIVKGPIVKEPFKEPGVTTDVITGAVVERPVMEMTVVQESVTEEATPVTPSPVAEASKEMTTRIRTDNVLDLAAPTEDEDDNDMTRIMEPVISPQEGSVLEETRVLSRQEMERLLQNEEEAAPTLSPWSQEAEEQAMVDLAIAPLLHTLGVVSDTTREHASHITRQAMERLHIKKMGEMQLLLENIVVQEAIMCMQKAYITQPEPWMEEAALEIFFDVVQQPKSSTFYLVAFDALRILPHITLGHFQAMTLMLLLQYSRNTNNYKKSYFTHYVEKYVEPFISDLPKDVAYFRQLEYLRCTTTEKEAIPFASLLANSYPYVFNFRGFTIEELQLALGDIQLDPKWVVKSLNSDLKKLAMVDDTMAPRFFRQARISDANTQQRLLTLMESKPTAFAGTEARHIMEDISPVLSDVADLYDRGPMSTTSLTLLGLYLGRIHVKTVIHEDFDLRRWFA